jgi:hypothetical protein
VSRRRYYDDGTETAAAVQSRRTTVPKSRVRKKPVYTPPARSVRRKASPPWVAPVMVACLVVGLIWIALYYITNGQLAGMHVLSYWNMVIGFVLIIAGVVLATQWR